MWKRQDNANRSRHEAIAVPSQLVGAGAQIASEVPKSNRLDGLSQGSSRHQLVASTSHISPHGLDASELVRHGEALIKRLATVSAGNAELQRQLEIQNKEVSLLEADGREQKQLCCAFEQQMDRLKQVEARAAERRARSKSKAREEELRLQLEASLTQASAAQEALEVRCRKSEDARKELEYELGRVREQLERQTRARLQTEDMLMNTKERETKLEKKLTETQQEANVLRQALASHSNAAQHWEARYRHVQARLEEQSCYAEKRVRREQRKFDAVSRLGAVLPRHTLAKAFA